MNESLWEKYGLSHPAPGVLTREESQESITGHWRVVKYLESHPEIATKYKPDQSGEIKYFDVLALAEMEKLIKEVSDYLQGYCLNPEEPTKESIERLAKLIVTHVKRSL